MTRRAQPVNPLEKPQFHPARHDSGEKIITAAHHHP
jgi:hypothetical protein